MKKLASLLTDQRLTDLCPPMLVTVPINDWPFSLALYLREIFCFYLCLQID